MNQARSIDIRLPRNNQVRVVLDLYARAGCYHPELHFHLKGPNGSVSGHGPKAWPAFLVRHFGHIYQPVAKGYTPTREALMLSIKIPGTRWSHKFSPLRLKVWNLERSLLQKVVG